MNYQQTAEIAYTQFAYMFFKSMFQPDDYASSPRYMKDILAVTMDEFVRQDDFLSQPEFYAEFYAELSEGNYFVEFFEPEMDLDSRKEHAEEFLANFLELLYPGCIDHRDLPIIHGVSNEHQAAFNNLHEMIGAIMNEIIESLHHDEMEQHRIEFEKRTKLLDSENDPLGKNRAAQSLEILKKIQNSDLVIDENDLNAPYRYGSPHENNIRKQQKIQMHGHDIYYQLLSENSNPQQPIYFTTIVTAPAGTTEYVLRYISENLPSFRLAQAEIFFERQLEVLNDLIQSSSKGNPFFEKQVLGKSAPPDPTLLDLP